MIKIITMKNLVADRWTNTMMIIKITNMMVGYMKNLEDKEDDDTTAAPLGRTQRLVQTRTPRQDFFKMFTCVDAFYIQYTQDSSIIAIVIFVIIVIIDIAIIVIITMLTLWLLVFLIAQPEECRFASSQLETFNIVFWCIVICTLILFMVVYLLTASTSKNNFLERIFFLFLLYFV